MVRTRRSLVSTTPNGGALSKSNSVKSFSNSRRSPSQSDGSEDDESGPPVLDVQGVDDGFEMNEEESMQVPVTFKDVKQEYLEAFEVDQEDVAPPLKKIKNEDQSSSSPSPVEAKQTLVDVLAKSFTYSSSVPASSSTDAPPPLDMEGAPSLKPNKNVRTAMESPTDDDEDAEAAGPPRLIPEKAAISSANSRLQRGGVYYTTHARTKVYVPVPRYVNNTQRKSFVHNGMAVPTFHPSAPRGRPRREGLSLTDSILQLSRQKPVVVDVSVASASGGRNSTDDGDPAPELDRFDNADRNDGSVSEPVSDDQMTSSEAPAKKFPNQIVENASAHHLGLGYMLINGLTRLEERGDGSHLRMAQDVYHLFNKYQVS